MKRRSLEMEDLILELNANEVFNFAGPGTVDEDDEDFEVFDDPYYDRDDEYDDEEEYDDDDDEDEDEEDYDYDDDDE